ncbi:NrtR DNA-binding winged helix domain-containing protein [Piscinibacter sakaiensis]|uniref:NrtR DNA-binding winged helix domain-containing protein n=1 Tax=Piscinibacter sakaiensis TaxID=1547922 RepID=UPI003AADBAEC
MISRMPNRHELPSTRIELVLLGIVDGQLSVLLGERHGEPHAGRWALPGGVLRIDQDADLDAAVQRTAVERLGVALPFFRQLLTVGSMSRDPGAPWSLAIVYRALLPADVFQAGAGKRTDEWRWFAAEEAAADRRLAFEHAELIGRAIAVTRSETDQLLLPAGLLPATFTLSELQQVCEQILGRRLDKASFRRKLAERELVQPIEGEMRGGANRPAQVHRLRVAGS